MKHLTRKTVAIRLGLSTVAAASLAVPATSASVADNHVLTLSGVGQYFTVPHSASLAASSEITVEYWVRTSNTSGVGRIGKTAPSDGQWGLEVNARGEAMFDIHSNASSGVTSHPMNEWFHLAGTWKQSTGVATVYINGQLRASAVGWGTTMQSVNYPIVIGYQPGYSITQLYGSVDNFRVWTVARTQAEIQSLMHQQLSPAASSAYSGLVLSLDFENGGTDASQYANNGTFVGGASVTVDNSFLIPAPGVLALAGLAGLTSSRRRTA